MRAPVLVLLLAVLSSGCTLPPEAPESPPPAATTSLPPAPPYQPDPLPARLAETPLAAQVEPRWVRPGEVLTATADGAGTVDWFLANRNPIPARPAAPLAFRPTARAPAAGALTEPGLHVFSAEEAAFEVLVVPGAAAADLRVVLVRTAEGWDARPQAVRGAPGARLVVEALDGDAVQVRRVGLHPHLGSGAATTFHLPEGYELGDHEVVAISWASGAWGRNATRIVHDVHKPETAWSVGPFRGAFPASGASAPARHAWDALHDARGVNVTFSATSRLPAPTSLRLSLLDATGEEVASGGPPGFALPSLPRGSYAFVVTAEEGALLEYEVAASGEWLLEPPASFFAS